MTIAGPRHSWWRPTAVAALLFSTLGICGCTALQEVAAVRSVAFSFDRVGEVRLAGVPLGPATRFSTLGIADLARLTAGVVTSNVPLELVVHARAENPASNHVAARLVSVVWRLFIEDRETVAGTFGDALNIMPGKSADVPVAVRFNLYDLGSGGAKDLFETATAIAGYGTIVKNLRLELVPTIDTSLGPIAYPVPVVLRRTVGN